MYLCFLCVCGGVVVGGGGGRGGGGFVRVSLFVSVSLSSPPVAVPRWCC